MSDSGFSPLRNIDARLLARHSRPRNRMLLIGAVFLAALAAIVAA